MGWTSGSASDGCGFDAQALGMKLRGSLKVEIVGGLFALGGELRKKRFAVGSEEGLDRGGLGCVGGCARRRAGLIAGREALVHLLIDATGMFG